MSYLTTRAVGCHGKVYETGEFIEFDAGDDLDVDAEASLLEAHAIEPLQNARIAENADPEADLESLGVKALRGIVIAEKVDVDPKGDKPTLIDAITAHRLAKAAADNQPDQG